MNRFSRWVALLALGTLAALLSACGSAPGAATSGESSASTGNVATSRALPPSGGPATSTPQLPTDTTDAATSPANGSAVTGSPAGPATTLVGSGCADDVSAMTSGAGSTGSTALDPVMKAASSNPLLSTFVAALSGKVNRQVNLASTLNAGEFTVFAPVDRAFTTVDATTLTEFTQNAALLQGTLAYHLVPGKLAPSDIVGTHPTLEGQNLEVAGPGTMLSVNGARVVCGGLPAQNATLYLIDQVLTPPDLPR